MGKASRSNKSLSLSYPYAPALQALHKPEREKIFLLRDLEVQLGRGG